MKNAETSSTSLAQRCHYNAVMDTNSFWGTRKVEITFGSRERLVLGIFLFLPKIGSIVNHLENGLLSIPTSP